MNESHLAYYDTVDGVFSHAESLKKMGLNIPQLTELFLKLKEKGYDVSTDVYTMEKAESELLVLLKGGDKNAQ
jgi:energy-coupling factor transport system ATP-binding protein